MLNLFLAPFQLPFMVNARCSDIDRRRHSLRAAVGVSGAQRLGADGRRHERTQSFRAWCWPTLSWHPLRHRRVYRRSCLCAVTTGFLDDNSRLKRDTIMGIVFSGMFGAGLVLCVAIQSRCSSRPYPVRRYAGDLPPRYWANDGDRTGDCVDYRSRNGGIFAARLRSSTQAKASGLRGGLLHYGLLCAIALTIVATLQSVGIILSISLLIAPGPIALLPVRRFIHALLLAVAVAIGCSAGGVWLAFYLDSAPAPTIVVCCLPRCLWVAFVASTIRDSQETETSAMYPRWRLTPCLGLQEHDLSPGCASADQGKQLLFGRYFFRQRRHRAPVVQRRWRIVRIGWRQSIRGPAQRIICFHLLALRRLVAVHRTLLAGRFILAKHALIRRVVSVGVQRLIVRIIGLRLRDSAAGRGQSSAESSFFPVRYASPSPAFRLF